MYTISGKAHKQVDGYAVWEVAYESKVACSFFGPMAFLAATAFAKAMNEDSHTMADAQAVLAKYPESDDLLESDNLFKKVRSIIVELLGVEPKEVTLEADIKRDLCADSLDIVELIMAVEVELNIDIPDEKLEGVKKVKDVVAFIKRLPTEA